MSNPWTIGRIALAVAITTALLFINLFPIAWGLVTSLKATPEIMAWPPRFIDFSPTLDHYRSVMASLFTRAIANSLFYSGGVIAVGLLLGSLAAFGFDRFAFRLRDSLFMLIVASIPLAIGAAALLVPNYLYFTYLGVTNRWFTLVLLYTAYQLPLAIWILKGAMEGVPRELDEAAYVDGATSFTVWRRIVMPLCLPAIGAAGLFLFLGSWNEFVAGSVMVDSPELRPVQVAVYQNIGYFGRDWGPLMASAMLAVIPILAIYLLLGRLLISGLTRGAVK